MIHSRVCTDKRDHDPTFMYPVSDYELTLPALLLMQQVQQARAQEERQVSRHSLLTSLFFSTCAPPACMSWIHLVYPHCCARKMVCVWTHLIVAMNTQALCPRLHACTMNGWLMTLLSEGYPFHSQFLCTAWLNPNVLALFPGFCIAVPLLSVLMHGCFKDSPDCLHEHSNYVPSFAPTN
jgi:hypothetical protein